MSFNVTWSRRWRRRGAAPPRRRRCGRMRAFRDGVVPTQAHIGEDLSEEKIENLVVSALDPSGDGAVDFDEFKQFINRRDKVGISQSRGRGELIPRSRTNC